MQLTAKQLEVQKGEIWKDVIGYEGLYMVSNLGRIYSTTKGDMLIHLLENNLLPNKDT